ncbi:FtsX-like permease family protein [Pedobacter sp. HMF7647]|uniref:FtsX-like permease family protein n=1 Tax=Hufsiella arboris TaxID=2695275 RepID=A0A7K1YAS5_9SPHI|nr:ABC transporter permease [Hufsiella arboris]MXV51461.1 FtsX-like permease family protein [Hufsiella arboris]
MFKTNLKIAWRNLLKDKQFTILNVLGLSAGLACALLIFLWVSDEIGYDKFFANDDRLFKLIEQRTNTDGAISYSEESSGRLSEAVKQSVSGVEYAAAVAPPGWFPQNTLSVKDKNLKANGQYAEKDYFNIFSFPLIAGNRNNVLANNNSIVLSDELAVKLFGTTDNIIGKPVNFDHDTTFFVSGIFKKMPVNSSQQFDFVLSFDYFKTIKNWVTNWRSTGPLNYVLLKKGVSLEQFNKNVKNTIKKNSEDTTTNVVAMKFSDMYLHNNYNGNAQSGGRIEYVKLFSLLAVFVMAIACINFMNLSTAKAARRFKEVGIKKVVGAARKQLIIQFLTESFLLTLIAMGLAIAIAVFLLPAFNQITGKNISLHFTWQMITGIIGIALVTGFLSGGYPALYISKFNPLSVLKGQLNTSAAELLSRKGLVVFQFTLSTVLIVTVFVIYQQIQFIQNADPGYNKNNVIRLAAEGGLSIKQDAFIAELKKINGVKNASATNHRMVGHNFATNGLEWAGKPLNDNTFFEGFETDYNFVETMGMHIKEGRAFLKTFGADSTTIILNEAAVKAMHLADPLGKIVKLDGRNMQVIGIVKDFHFESMHAEIKPSYLVLVPQRGTIVASISSNNQQVTISAIEQLYKRFNPGFPFTFNFLNESYQQQYESETRVSALSKYFAGLAIIISCLGLFGLAAFTAQKRRKEIGIRKVVGASVSNITAMLSKDFLKLIVISLLIAFPVSWWLMYNWLQGFAYRIHLTPATFVIAGIAVIIITLFTISFQSIKAAVANPVKSLRTE